MKAKRQILRRSIVALVALMMVTSYAHSAEDRRRPGRGGGGLGGIIGDILGHGHVRNSLQEQNIKRLLEATESIVEAAGTRNHYAAEAKLRIASYRIRLVQVTLRASRGSRAAEEALEITMLKLNDRYLRLNEKVNIALDCIGVAIGELASDMGRQDPVDAAKLALKFTQLIAPCNVFGVVSSVLGQVQNILYRTHGPGVRQARDAIDIAIAKANDPYLRPAEKQYFVLDCVGVALRALR